MKKTKSVMTVFLIIVFWQIMAYPQAQEYTQDLIDGLSDFQRVGQSAMPFLKFGAGARSMAMGDAMDSQYRDASSLFYNPAGIAHAQGKQAMFSQMSYLLGTNILAGAASIDCGNLGVFGLSMLYYDYGDPIIATQIDATENGYSIIGEMNPIEMYLGVGYARRISDKFSIGGQVKFAHQDLLGSGGVKTRTAVKNINGEWDQSAGDAIQNIFAFDFGTIYNTGWRGLSFAMAFRNFGKEIKYEREKYDLPLSFQFGLSCDMFELLNNDNEAHTLIFNIDRIHPRDWSERMNFGLEYGLLDMLFLRAGYKQNYSSEGLTLGSGFHWNWNSKIISVDYAFKVSDYALDNVHVTSISFKY